MNSQNARADETDIRTSAAERRLPALRPLLLRLREVAMLLGVSERQVWTLVRTKQLPVVRPPGMRTIRVAYEDVEALVAAWRRESLEL